MKMIYEVYGPEYRILGTFADGPIAYVLVDELKEEKAKSCGADKPPVLDPFRLDFHVRVINLYESRDEWNEFSQSGIRRRILSRLTLDERKALGF